MELIKEKILDYLLHCKVMCFICLILLLITIGSVYYTFTKECICEIEKEEITQVVEEPTIEVEEKIEYKIDVKGAVKTPGVYLLEKESRVIDAINMAGGLTKQADVTYLNLSKRIKDEMVILVYTKDEIKKRTEEIEVVCNCPVIENDACLNDNTTSNEKISINKASLEELQSLPGIGESIASKIITYREENGNFENLEDLKNVNGVGDSLYSKIADFITL